MLQVFCRFHDDRNIKQVARDGDNTTERVSKAFAAFIHLQKFYQMKVPINWRWNDTIQFASKDEVSQLSSFPQGVFPLEKEQQHVLITVCSTTSLDMPACVLTNAKIESSNELAQPHQNEVRKMLVIPRLFKRSTESFQRHVAVKITRCPPLISFDSNLFDSFLCHALPTTTEDVSSRPEVTPEQGEFRYSGLCCEGIVICGVQMFSEGLPDTSEQELVHLVANELQNSYHMDDQDTRPRTPQNEGGILCPHNPAFSKAVQPYILSPLHSPRHRSFTVATAQSVFPVRIVSVERMDQLRDFVEIEFDLSAHVASDMIHFPPKTPKKETTCCSCWAKKSDDTEEDMNDPMSVAQVEDIVEQDVFSWNARQQSSSCSTKRMGFFVASQFAFQQAMARPEHIGDQMYGQDTVTKKTLHDLLTAVYDSAMVVFRQWKH